MFSWCIARLISWLHFQWPDLVLSANCSRLSSKQGNTNLSGHVPNTEVCSLCVLAPHQSSMMCMLCVCVFICTSIPCELSPHPIDGSHITTLYKAASPLKWNTCSAVQQVLFYNSSKYKMFYSVIVFRQWVMIEMKMVFYGYFMWVVFMENWVVIDIIKGLILTLCPDLAPVTTV